MNKIDTTTCRWCETIKEDTMNFESYDYMAIWEYLQLATISDGICKRCSEVLERKANSIPGMRSMIGELVQLAIETGVIEDPHPEDVELISKRVLEDVFKPLNNQE